MPHLLRRHEITRESRGARLLWNVAWALLYRPSPRVFHSWRANLLRLFGARIGRPVYIYPSSRVWAPWNLVIGDHSTLADNVDCYNVDKVVIGTYTTVSQYCYLCTATHDYNDPVILEKPQLPLLVAQITLADRVWITADVFIGPGVKIGDGAVVLARSVVNRDVEPWTIVSGFPAVFKKKRILR